MGEYPQHSNPPSFTFVKYCQIYPIANLQTPILSDQSPRGWAPFLTESIQLYLVGMLSKYCIRHTKKLDILKTPVSFQFERLKWQQTWQISFCCLDNFPEPCRSRPSPLATPRRSGGRRSTRSLLSFQPKAWRCLKPVASSTRTRQVSHYALYSTSTHIR
jgi:hypothetical protein